VDQQILKRISAEVEKENLLFANKAFLGNLTLPSEISGRSSLDQTNSLLHDKRGNQFRLKEFFSFGYYIRYFSQCY
jgi:hypothetical protein